MFHDTRRYSPSVTDCNPAASCFAITPATSRSSIALKASTSISLRARRSRAALSAGVRKRLPTWSARKGGVVRWVIRFLSSPASGGGGERSEPEGALARPLPPRYARSPSPASAGEDRSPPHLLGEFDDHLKLRQLFVLREDVAFLGRGEAALRRQTELIQRDIF